MQANSRHFGSGPGGKRTDAQKADDLKRHLESVERASLEAGRSDIDKEVYTHKLKVQWLYQIKNRAKQKNLDFNLTIDDIELPEKCPILGIPLRFNTVAADENSFSLDRIDNTKGYVKGNIQVVSLKANKFKSNASLDEIIALGEWARALKAQLGEQPDST
jgi:hypothetical protein